LLSSDALRGFYSDLEAGELDARNRRLSEIEEWDDPLSFIIVRKVFEGIFDTRRRKNKKKGRSISPYL
jgi:hypothetical protein